MPNTIDLVRVPGAPEPIEALQDTAGDIWVSPKRVCESLGLDWGSQRRKLSSAENPWAVVSTIPAAGADGKEYRMYMISMDSLPMWLAGIKPGKVLESSPALKGGDSTLGCSSPRGGC